MALPTCVGLGRKAVGDIDGHHHRHREGAQEVADEYQAPVAQHALERDARALVDQRQWAQHEHAGQQVEAEQVQHDKAHREQHGAQQRLAGLHIDGDGEPGRQGQDGAGHVSPDNRVAGGHEDFGFTRIHHLGHKFRRH
jgi:hypothetical protein